MYRTVLVRPIARLRPVMLATILVFGAFWHWIFLPIFTIDVANDYVPWFNHIVAKGPVGAFAHPFGAYSPPYLYLLAGLTAAKGVLPDPYLIKLLALAGNVALAAACWRLFDRLSIAQPGRVALCLLALPSLLINAALLGQCDALYVAPCVMGIAAALDRRHRAMLAWCGLALAVKPQAVLIGPFVLAILIARRVPFRQWLIAPAVLIATLVPAWLAGWPALDLLLIHFRQVETFKAVVLNAPNIWMIVDTAGIDSAPLSGLALASAIGAGAAYAAGFGATARHLGRPALVRLALLAPLLLAGLLPRMHERYFLLADILSIAVALTAVERGAWRIPLLIQIGSTLALFAYLTGVSALAAAGGVAMIAATWLVLRPLLVQAANDNPILMAVPPARD